MSVVKKWAGARWWKFDFHTHTPASDDYGKNFSDQKKRIELSPKQWLLDFMQAGIDCVAITDHNSGAWIDKLKQALAELRLERPENFRDDFYIFPGVEISVYGGIHLLAIFGENKTTSDIDSLLGAVGYRGTKGSCDAVTEKSLQEVVAEIRKSEGIAIPAHTDTDTGLFNKLNGSTLQQFLDCNDVYAIEILNLAQKPLSYIQSQCNWTEILGSDLHHPPGESGQNYPDSCFTWVKMGQPNVEGLRLALLDGKLSVIRADESVKDPNHHADLVIEAIEVENARYMGRPSLFRTEFNPWMNTIIGGRGTGKSTLIEFLRLTLRRKDDLYGELRSDFEKYERIYHSRSDEGLLTDKALIRVFFRKDSAMYRIQWDPSGNIEPIEEEISDNKWHRSEGDIRQRFPIHIFSQKQIFYLAKEPLALLKIINDAKEVGFNEWKINFDRVAGQYLSSRSKIREISATLTEEHRLKGELEDIKRKLSTFEKTGHADTLKALQMRHRQINVVENWEKALAETCDRIRQLAQQVVLEDFDKSVFNEGCAEDAELLRLVKATAMIRNELVNELYKIAEKAEKETANWYKKKETSSWQQAVLKTTNDYETLIARLKEQNVSDPSEYGPLMQKRQAIELKLKEIAARKKQIDTLEKQAQIILTNIFELRREITKKRADFLAKVLEENSFVRIKVKAYGAVELVENEFRELIQRVTGGFERDIGSPGSEGMLGKLYRGEPSPVEFEKHLADLKDEIRSICNNPEQAAVEDKRFASHLSKLKPEMLDRLNLWFPEDSLEVEYSTNDEQKRFRPIREGSPGQKTAALLAFLLSYGEEPVILDQPEDDLDNHLIYDLIVAQLKRIKRKRQVIVVTHNANIVVNGDAEMVVALDVQAGQTQKEASGCLQEKMVRETICRVMEGGREAFEQRYRRILLEGHHV